MSHANCGRMLKTETSRSARLRCIIKKYMRDRGRLARCLTMAMSMVKLEVTAKRRIADRVEISMTASRSSLLGTEGVEAATATPVAVSFPLSNNVSFIVDKNSSSMSSLSFFFTLTFSCTVCWHLSLWWLPFIISLLHPIRPQRTVGRVFFHASFEIARRSCFTSSQRET